MWTLITAAIFLLLVVTPAAAHHKAGHGPSGSPPVTGALVVVDANDTVIGHYLGWGLVSREFDGARVDFCCIMPDGTAQADVSVTLVYSDEACEGTPFLFFDDAFDLGLFRNGSVLDSGHITFAGERVTIHARSVRSSNDPGCWVIEEGGIPNYPVAVAVFVPILELGVPPFRVR